MNNKLKVGSDFSGCGAFIQALLRLGLNFKEVFACDCDPHARNMYQLQYGNDFYFPDDVYKREIPSESLDIFVSSPPCQGFSIAGKRDGSILFYNSLEFIKTNKPRYFIFENVKGLLSHDKKANSTAKYGRTFSTWLELLGGKSINNQITHFPNDESVPYHIYFKVINAKECNVPQNRERVFIVGIRYDNDNKFSFPKKVPLQRKLKDVLEHDIPTKYYLSQKMIDGFITKENTSKWNFEPLNGTENSSKCITARYAKMAITDNFIIEGHINQETQASRVYSDEGIAPTITTSSFEQNNFVVEPEVSFKVGTYRTHNDGKGFRQIADNTCPTIAARAREDGSGQPVLLEKRNNDEYRIRRLTEREVFRLMDFPESFMDKVVEYNQANPKKKISGTQLYKMAGNSIVVQCLVNIIKNLKLD